MVVAICKLQIATMKEPKALNIFTALEVLRGVSWRKLNGRGRLKMKVQLLHKGFCLASYLSWSGCQEEGEMKEFDISHS